MLDCLIQSVAKSHKKPETLSLPAWHFHWPASLVSCHQQILPCTTVRLPACCRPAVQRALASMTVPFCQPCQRPTTGSHSHALCHVHRPRSVQPPLPASRCPVQGCLHSSGSPWLRSVHACRPQGCRTCRSPRLLLLLFATPSVLDRNRLLLLLLRYCAACILVCTLRVLPLLIR